MGKMHWVLLLLVIFFNHWIWRILSLSPVMGIMLVLDTVLLSIVIIRKTKVEIWVWICLTTLLFVFQYHFTEVKSLSMVNNDDRRVIDIRMRAHMPVYFSIGEKTLWIPTAHWFEEKPELLVLTRFQQNLFENLDLNQYFFAGHPKERLNQLDFEKFNYVMLPFALIGWFTLVKKSKFLYWLYLTMSLFFLGLISNHTSMGPAILFPGVAIAIVSGLQTILRVDDKTK